MIKIARLMALALLLAGSPLAAGTVRRAPDPVRDQRHTMQARRLLMQDPDLAAFNIGVIVQDRVAILWGPVPSADVAFRAELCIRTMVELAEVRNELILNELLEPVRRPLRIEKPAQILPELLPPELPKDVRSKNGSPGVLTGQDAATGKPANAQTAGNVKKQTAGDRPGEAPPVIQAKPAEPGRELETAIRAILQQAPSYSSIQFAIQDGRVYLRCKEANQSDVLQEAARAIARLPSVDGVIVLD